MAASAPPGLTEKQLHAWKMQQYIDSLGSSDDEEGESEDEEDYNLHQSGMGNKFNNSNSIGPQGRPTVSSNASNANSKGSQSIYEQLRARGVTVNMTQVPLSKDDHSDED